MTRDSRRFLQPEAISRSRGWNCGPERRRGVPLGHARSPYFGQSVEFVQHREYVAGDDIRHIDWKVWSKTDQYYIKQYEAETNLRCTLVVDVSESMHYGTRAAQQVRVRLHHRGVPGYLLLRQQDAVGPDHLRLGESRQVVPPRSQRNHLHAVLDGARRQKPGEKTDIVRDPAPGRRDAVAAGHDRAHLRPVRRPRDGLFKGLEMLRHGGHDVLVFHVMDDEEWTSPSPARRGSRAGGGRRAGLRPARHCATATWPRSQAVPRRLRRNCARQTIDYQTIRTSEHLDAALAQY